MLRQWRVACIQMGASGNLEENFFRAVHLTERAVRQKARFVTLPENFLSRGPSRDLKAVTCEMPRVIRHFQKLARETKSAILLGSLLEPTSATGKYSSTSVLVSETGKIAARYRKMHLFDIGLRRVRMNESRHIQAGKRLGLGKVFGIPLGLAICYDLRFPELFRRLTYRGARIITVPANFTDYTGEAHWEVLLRARAIENQVFIVAPAQVGISPSSGIRSFGTSLIIDPWGTVLAKGTRTRDEVVVADLDFSFQARLRSQFPVLKHLTSCP